MKAIIKAGDMENDLLATADVEVEGFGTFRNVRIKNGDYEPGGGPAQDPSSHHRPLARDIPVPQPGNAEQFNATVLDAYHQELEPQHQSGRLMSSSWKNWKVKKWA